MGLPLRLGACARWLGSLLLSDIGRRFTFCGLKHCHLLHFAQMMHCMYSKPLYLLVWLGLLTVFQARIKNGALHVLMSVLWLKLAILVSQAQPGTYTSARPWRPGVQAEDAACHGTRQCPEAARAAAELQSNAAEGFGGTQKATGGPEKTSAGVSSQAGTYLMI